MLFASPGLSVSPTEDLLFNATARIPAIQALTGTQREGPEFELALVYDL